jgi:hypothetical protein
MHNEGDLVYGKRGTVFQGISREIMVMMRTRNCPSFPLNRTIFPMLYSHKKNASSITKHRIDKENFAHTRKERVWIIGLDPMKVLREIHQQLPLVGTHHLIVLVILRFGVWV